MQRGSLIIYDNTGKIWFKSGDAEGDILPHVLPEGLQHIITEFGQLNNKRVLSVDPVTKEVVTEDIEVKPTYEELETQLLLNEGVI